MTEPTDSAISEAREELAANWRVRDRINSKSGVQSWCVEHYVHGGWWKSSGKAGRVIWFRSKAAADGFAFCAAYKEASK